MFFDILGRKARTFVDKTQGAGYYSVPIRSTELPGGVFFLRMEAGEYQYSLLTNYVVNFITLCYLIYAKFYYKGTN